MDLGVFRPASVISRFVSQSPSHLHYSEVQKPPSDEAVLVCQESHGSDPYSPQISSCSSTMIEFPMEQESKTNVKNCRLRVFSSCNTKIKIHEESMYYDRRS